MVYTDFSRIGQMPQPGAERPGSVAALYRDAHPRDGEPHESQVPMAFLLTHARLLGFGFTAAFFASFGQTYFIALFSAPLREAFGLSHGAFGTVYALGTLTSAALLIQVGALLDRVDLRTYALAVLAAYAGICAYMALIPVQSVVFLYLAIFGLRFLGQGLSSHMSATTMARYFEAARGRALSIAALGHPAGEAVFPTIGVVLIAALGWRGAWGAAAVILAVFTLPLILWLLRGQAERHADFLAAQREKPDMPAISRRALFRDPRFMWRLPAILAPGFINTGIFFSQVHIAEVKGWSLQLFAAGIAAYAGAAVAGSLITGVVIDRVGAVRLFPFVFLPLAAAMAWLALSAAPLTVFGFMALAGLSGGAYAAVSGALWAEIYGVAQIGAIRSLTVSIMVFSTALSPPLMGWAIDLGLSVNILAAGFAVYALTGACLAGLAPRARPASVSP